MHPLLYFLYTGRVNLNPNGTPGWVNAPQYVDAYSLYSLAHRFGVENLKDICFDYLRKTLTVDNVVERLFKIPRHAEVERLYRQFLLTNFNAVKDTDSWTEVVMENARARPQTALLLDITKSI